MSARKTCDKCANYAQDADLAHVPFYSTAGACLLIGDTNTLDRDKPFPVDRAHGWDYEGYKAGAYVGPKFGCIHWVAKSKATKEAA